MKRASTAFCRKEQVKCICVNCIENRSKHQKGRCEGCNRCGNRVGGPCLILQNTDFK